MQESSSIWTQSFVWTCHVVKVESLSCDWAQQQFSAGGEQFMLGSNRNITLLIGEVLSGPPPQPQKMK